MIATQYFGIWQLVAQQLIFVVVIVSRWRRHGRPPALLRGWLGTALPMAVGRGFPLALLMKQQFSIDQATGQAFGVAANAGFGTTASTRSSPTWSMPPSASTPTAVITDLSSFWPFAMLAGLALLGGEPGR